MNKDKQKFPLIVMIKKMNKNMMYTKKNLLILLIIIVKQKFSPMGIQYLNILLDKMVEQFKQVQKHMKVVKLKYHKILQELLFKLKKSKYMMKMET